MENKDRNSNKPSTNERGIDKDSLNEKKVNTPKEGEDEGVIDLDGDGMIGNTGGFYGGTSYVGSNYGADWNAENNEESKHEGNYGAAGNKEDTADDKKD